MLGRLALFVLIIFDGCRDGVLGHHTALLLDGWQLQVGGNIGILNGQDVIDRLSLDPFRRDGGTSNGGATSKRLEFRIRNDTILIDLNLQLHDIATGGGTHESLYLTIIIRGETSRDCVRLYDDQSFPKVNCWATYRSNIVIILIKRAYVSWILIFLYDHFMVKSLLLRRRRRCHSRTQRSTKDAGGLRKHNGCT